MIFHSRFVRMADGRYPAAHARVRYPQHSWRHRRIRSGCHGNARHQLAKTRHDKWVHEKFGHIHTERMSKRFSNLNGVFTQKGDMHLGKKLTFFHSLSVGVNIPLILPLLFRFNKGVRIPHLVSRLRNRWVDRRDENEEFLHRTWRCCTSFVNFIWLLGFACKKVFMPFTWWNFFWCFVVTKTAFRNLCIRLFQT